MFAKTAIVAFFAGLAAAVHAPVGEPNGNPITRPLNEAVTAGTPFTITWQPTTTNKVSLLLLKGPSTNVVQVGAPIAEGIANSGSYTWTPPADFGPGLSETTGYGIQLIDDVTGQYQYSTQFGITIPKDYKPSSSVELTSTKGGYGGYPTSTAESSKVVYSSAANSTTAGPTATSHPIASTGYPVHNSTAIQPSKPLTVPSSLKTSATATPPPASSTVPTPPASTGAAAHLKAGFGLAIGVAGLFFML